MLKNKKILLASAVLATVSVMNSAYADLDCTSVTSIELITTNATATTTPVIPSNTDVALCGLEVEGDPARTAAVAILVSSVPSLAKTAAKSLAGGGTRATLASKAFSTILADPLIDEDLKASVADAAQKVIEDNPDEFLDADDKPLLNAITTKLIGQIVAVKPKAFADTDKLKAILELPAVIAATETAKVVLNSDPIGVLTNVLNGVNFTFKPDKIGSLDTAANADLLKTQLVALNTEELIKLSVEKSDGRSGENTCRKPMAFGFFPTSACSPSPKPIVVVRED